MTDGLREAADVRPCRSLLSVPAGSPALFEKAARSKADAVILDLEDSVAPDSKAEARASVIAGLRDVDWGDRIVCLRINACDTPFMYRDLIDTIEQGGDRLDTIMIPKVNSPAEVAVADMLASQVEAAVGRQRPLGLEVLIETAAGLAAVDAIAAASPRIQALHLGLGDFAASLGARTTVIGGQSSDYGVLSEATDDNRARAFHPGDIWHYALARLLVAARALGLRAIDGPYADFRDVEGVTSLARRSAAMGFDGKWAIHPSQIDPINRCFTPTEAETSRARAILEAMEAARRDGRAAVTLDGRMIDIASIKQAAALIGKVDRISSKEK